MNTIKIINTIAFIGLLLFISACNRPQQSEKIDSVFVNLPILKWKKNNPALQVLIEGDSINTQTVTELSFTLNDNIIQNVKSVQVFYSGTKENQFIDDQAFGKGISPQKQLIVSGKQTLKAGKNYFWLSFQLKDDCDLLTKLQAKLAYATVNEQRLSPLNPIDDSKFWRTGVALRQHRQDNVHTYRIPGLATTNNGTLLVIYDVRRESGRDLQGHIDIGVSRSTDGGETWEAMRIAQDMGQWGNLPEKFNGVSDACILVDKNSDNIFIAGLWMHGVINAEGKWLQGLNEESSAWNHQWRNRGSQPGLEVNQTSQFIISKSTDDGQTWSKPVNLTEMCKKKEWWLWAPAPGAGITMKDGTLVFPTQGRNQTGLPFSNITYSKDGGKTWITSNQAFSNTTECAVVELKEGELMLNMRDNRNRKEKGDNNGRAIFTTTDMGANWTEHTTHHGALIEPVCMASLYKHEYKTESGDKKSVLLFSNPNSKQARIKQTIKMSFDKGQSWPEKYWIELDEYRAAGYSCLSSIDNHTIGIVYEGSQAHMTFQKIDITAYLEDFQKSNE
jgi:sialidase-1